MQFFVCSSCARHVKFGEAVCPFCGTVADARSLTKRPFLPGVRDRSTLMFGAAMATAFVAATAAAGCEPSSPPVAPMYGGPPVHEINVNSNSASDGGAPNGSPIDAGPTTNATDAGKHSPDYPPAALYGAPPVDPTPPVAPLYGAAPTH